MLQQFRKNNQQRQYFICMYTTLVAISTGLCYFLSSLRFFLSSVLQWLLTICLSMVLYVSFGVEIVQIFRNFLKPWENGRELVLQNENLRVDNGVWVLVMIVINDGGSH